MTIFSVLVSLDRNSYSLVLVEEALDRSSLRFDLRKEGLVLHPQGFVLMEEGFDFPTPPCLQRCGEFISFDS
jgi:hypothetical protein